MSGEGRRELVAGFYENFNSSNIDAAPRFVGTHTGPLAAPDGDVDPTGASVDLRFADFSRVQDGKIVSYHTYYDQLGLLTQLGLMGEPSE